MLNERETAALGALLLARELFEDVLPHFNWGASFLSASDIHKLNTTPAAISQAIRILTGD